MGAPGAQGSGADLKQTSWTRREREPGPPRTEKQVGRRPRVWEVLFWTECLCPPATPPRIFTG